MNKGGMVPNKTARLSHSFFQIDAIIGKPEFTVVRFHPDAAENEEHFFPVLFTAYSLRLAC